VIYFYRCLSNESYSFKHFNSFISSLNKELYLHLLNCLERLNVKQSIDNDFFNFFLENKDTNIEYFLIRDNFSGRLHSPVTNLPKLLRKQILLDNENIVEIDITQSQPLILSKLLYQQVGNNDFTAIIESGEDIYSYFQNAFRLTSREQAKKLFFRILFSKPNYTLNVLFDNANWIKWINRYKRIKVLENKNTLTKPHSNLAWLLQSTEVSIMSQIWLELVKHKITFLTVHDSVLVPESKRVIVTHLFNTILSKHFKTYGVATFVRTLS
jgi:hypothetical protein